MTLYQIANDTAPHALVSRSGLIQLVEAKETILNGTLKLGPVAVELTREAIEDILRLVKVSLSFYGFSPLSLCHPHTLT
jgi:hypothetical protein